MRHDKRFNCRARCYPTNITLGSFYWWFDRTAYRAEKIWETGDHAELSKLSSERCTRLTLSFGLLCFGLEMEWTWR